MKFQVFYLLLLGAAVVNADVAARYEKFRNQHIIGQMSKKQCDSVITRRHITMTGSNECKETNTFILAVPNHVKAICRGAGEPFGAMTKSLLPFHVIKCTLKNPLANYPNCEYRGSSSTRSIAIRCEERLPVHYDGDIVIINNS